MNKKLILTSVAIFFSSMMFAQAPSIQWQKSFGGDNYDFPYSIQQTSEGGYIVAGSTSSINSGDVTNNYAGTDCWVVKLTSVGTLQWQRSLGGNKDEEVQSIVQTSDGGYIFAGYTTSNDINVSGHHGFVDFWVVKLDKNGSIQWQKCLGGDGYDSAMTIQLTSDGGYIVAGSSSSSNGDANSNHGSLDFWIVKLDNIGGVQWQKSLGGSGTETAYSIQQTSDGGYIVAGSSNSKNGDVTGNHGNMDVWIIKLDTNGSLEWQKSLGGSGYDYANSIRQTSDGGYIMAGYSNSNDGDVTSSQGSYDSWIVKLDNNGVLQWQKSLGGSNYDSASSILQISSGDYIVAGTSSSINVNGYVTGNHGGSDYWVLRIDKNGNIQWQKSLGGSGDDSATSIQLTSNGGYVVAGSSSSNDGNVSGNNGKKDYWVVKLNKDILDTKETALKNTVIAENPVKDNLRIQSNETIISLQLYDAAGQLIKTGKSQNMSVKELSKGNYILKMQLENGKVISEKIIKE